MFGATGFLGRYVVNRLGKFNHIVVLASACECIELSYSMTVNLLAMYWHYCHVIERNFLKVAVASVFGCVDSTFIFVIFVTFVVISPPKKIGTGSLNIVVIHQLKYLTD